MIFTHIDDTVIVQQIPSNLLVATHCTVVSSHKNIQHKPRTETRAKTFQEAPSLQGSPDPSPEMNAGTQPSAGNNYYKQNLPIVFIYDNLFATLITRIINLFCRSLIN